MRIKRLDYKDLKTGWHLEDARFDDFNLLVGISGVGKSRIVSALRGLLLAVFDAALPHAEWVLEFEHEGRAYEWKGCTKYYDATNQAPILPEGVRFVKESVAIDGQVLLLRGDSQFTYDGKDLPQLDAGQSAIRLLQTDPRMSRVIMALKLFDFSTGASAEVHGGGVEVPIDILNSVLERAVEVGRENESEAVLFLAGYMAGGSRRGVRSKTAIAYLVQQVANKNTHVRRLFDTIKAELIDIFPSIRDVQVVPALVGGTNVLQVQVQEEGVDAWIAQPEVSSGMLRVFLHLVELRLMPPNSVVIIDEFENSLGHNCLGPLTDLILDRFPEIQFILTSHHPYVINQIEVEHWKLVQRKGANVRLVSARDIPALMAHSYHDAFIRLLNLPEFEEGIT